MNPSLMNPWIDLCTMWLLFQSFNFARWTKIKITRTIKTKVLFQYLNSANEHYTCWAWSWKCSYTAYVLRGTQPLLPILYFLYLSCLNLLKHRLNLQSFPIGLFSIFSSEKSNCFCMWNSETSYFELILNFFNTC